MRFVACFQVHIEQSVEEVVDHFSLLHNFLPISQGVSKESIKVRALEVFLKVEGMVKSV